MDSYPKGLYPSNQGDYWSPGYYWYSNDILMIFQWYSNDIPMMITPSITSHIYVVTPILVYSIPNPIPIMITPIHPKMSPKCHAKTYRTTNPQIQQRLMTIYPTMDDPKKWYASYPTNPTLRLDQGTMWSCATWRSRSPAPWVLRWPGRSSIPAGGHGRVGFEESGELMVITIFNNGWYGLSSHILYG